MLQNLTNKAGLLIDVRFIQTDLRLTCERGIYVVELCTNWHPLPCYLTLQHVDEMLQKTTLGPKQQFNAHRIFSLPLKILETTI